MEYGSTEALPVVPSGRLDQAILAAAQRHDPARAAVVEVETRHTLTYGELPDRVALLATVLRNLGVRPGHVVATMLPNGIPCVLTLLAAWSLEAAVTPMARGLSTEEVATQVTRTGADFLIGAEELRATWEPAAERAGLPQDRRFAMSSDLAGLSSPVEGEDEAADAGAAQDRGADPDAAALDGPPPGPQPFLGQSVALTPGESAAQAPAQRTAFLPLSSGTTALPKPVMLTHGALVANAVQFSAAVALPRDRVTLAVLPFSHVYGLTTILVSGLMRGDTLVTMARFQVEAAAQAMGDLGVTTMFVVPPIAEALATDAAVTPDVTQRLSLVVSGAAPLAPDVAQQLCSRVGAEIVQGYGLTEMGPVTHVMRPGTAMPLDSVGTPLPGVECRVVDPETGEDVTPPTVRSVSGVGELLVRGPAMMSGYLGDEASAAATAVTVDPDGWLHTGDLVSVDASRIVRIVDRIKEVLKNRGFQVSPAELEALLAEYPGVDDVAITGVRGPIPGDERPFALVKRCPGNSSGPSAEGLIRFVSDRTASHKHLAGVAFVERVPRSDAGKILRRELPQLLPEGVLPSR